MPSESRFSEIHERHTEILSPSFPALIIHEKTVNIEWVYVKYFDKLVTLKKICNPLKLQEDSHSVIYFNHNKFLLANQTKFLAKWEIPYESVARMVLRLEKLPNILESVQIAPLSLKLPW